MGAPFTPGPWLAMPDPRYIDNWQITAKTDGWVAGGECPDGWFIADVHAGAGANVEGAEGNARLIAAAPDLLEALEALAFEVRCNREPNAGPLHMALSRADAVIVKARGQS